MDDSDGGRVERDSMGEVVLAAGARWVFSKKSR